MPFDSKYRLSSINDRHIFDSLRVVMAWFFDLKFRNVHVMVFLTNVDVVIIKTV